MTLQQVLRKKRDPSSYILFSHVLSAVSNTSGAERGNDSVYSEAYFWLKSRELVAEELRHSARAHAPMRQAFEEEVRVNCRAARTPPRLAFPRLAFPRLASASDSGRRLHAARVGLLGLVVRPAITVYCCSTRSCGGCCSMWSADSGPMCKAPTAQAPSCSVRCTHDRRKPARPRASWWLRGIGVRALRLLAAGTGVGTWLIFRRT